MFFLSNVYSSYCMCLFICRVLEMGCYGLGVSRILQASVEVLSDGKHIRWPRMMAPYQIVIIPQKVKSTLTCTCFMLLGSKVQEYIILGLSYGPSVLKF